MGQRGVDRINIREADVRVGVFLFGGVEMPDAGTAGTRRWIAATTWAPSIRAHHELLACGELAEQLGVRQLLADRASFPARGL